MGTLRRLDRARDRAPVAVSLRRVWTADPFRFVGALSLFAAFAFFVFSRTGPRE